MACAMCCSPFYYQSNVFFVTMQQATCHCLLSRNLDPCVLETVPCSEIGVACSSPRHVCISSMCDDRCQHRPSRPESQQMALDNGRATVMTFRCIWPMNTPSTVPTTVTCHCNYGCRHGVLRLVVGACWERRLEL